MHGSRYDYSRSVYKGSETKLTIICRKHGPFRQSPYNHTSPRVRCGCSKCGRLSAASKQSKFAGEKFVQRARARHGQKYDYSRVGYQDAHTKVCIICPVHGKFWQQADSHIRKCGCPKCGAARRGKQRSAQANRMFISKARTIHGRKYDYAESHYSLARVSVVIRCPRHGPFLQTPNSHLSGRGCPGCRLETLRACFAKSSTEFRRDARKVHGNRFSYTDDYMNQITPLIITCRVHGPFKQLPLNHLKALDVLNAAMPPRHKLAPWITANLLQRPIGSTVAKASHTQSRTGGRLKRSPFAVKSTAFSGRLQTITWAVMDARSARMMQRLRA